MCARSCWKPAQKYVISLARRDDPSARQVLWEEWKPRGSTHNILQFCLNILLVTNDLPSTSCPTSSHVAGWRPTHHLFSRWRGADWIGGGCLRDERREDYTGKKLPNGWHLIFIEFKRCSKLLPRRSVRQNDGRTNASEMHQEQMAENVVSAHVLTTDVRWPSLQQNHRCRWFSIIRGFFLYFTVLLRLKNGWAKTCRFDVFEFRRMRQHTSKQQGRRTSVKLSL